MKQRDLFRPTPRPWNRGRIIGPKPPFKAITLLRQSAIRPCPVRSAEAASGLPQMRTFAAVWAGSDRRV
jgi:hypothetical protein